MRGRLGHRRHQSHRGRAGADDDDLLAGIIDIFLPELGMDDGAGEILHAREVGHIAMLIAIIARAHHQEIAGVTGALPVGTGLGAHRPACRLAIPIGMRHPGAEMDLRLNPVALGRVGDVFADRRTIGKHLAIGPGPEGEAKCVHVAIGSNARIAE